MQAMAEMHTDPRLKPHLVDITHSNARFLRRTRYSPPHMGQLCFVRLLCAASIHTERRFFGAQREHFAAGGGDVEGVLELGGEAAVGCEYGPAVV